MREGLAGAGRDTVVPLQAAAAFRLAAGLGDGPRTLLVGAPADVVHLEVMSAYLREAGRSGLDASWSVVPAGGLAAIPVLAALLGAPLEAAVLLGVGAGSPWVLELIQEGVVLPERLVALTEAVEQALERPLDRYRPAAGPSPAGRHLLCHQGELLPSVGREPLNRFARLFGLLAEL